MLQTFDQTRRKLLLASYIAAIPLGLCMAYYPIQTIIITLGLLLSAFIIKKSAPKLNYLKISCILLSIGLACILPVLNEFGIITIDKSFLIGLAAIAYFIYFFFCFKSFQSCLIIYLCVCSLSLFYLGIRPSENMPIITIDRILYIPIILSFAIRYIMKKRRYIRFPWHLGIILILVSHILSLAYAADRMTTINAIIKIILEYYLLAFIVWHTDLNSKKVFNWLLIPAIAVSIYGFIEAKLGYNPMFYLIKDMLPTGLHYQHRINEIRLFSHRINSVFNNPIIFSVYLVISISIVSFQFVKLSKTHEQKIINLTIISILLAALILTGTRGAWLATFVGILFAQIYSFKVKKLPFYLGMCFVFIIGICLAIGYANTFINGVISLFQRDSSSFGSGIYRLELIQESISQIGFWGIGVNNYTRELGIFRGFSVGDLCNDFVSIGIEQGIIGIVAYLIFYTQLFYAFFRRSRTTICALLIPWMIVIILEGSQTLMPYFIVLVTILYKQSRVLPCSPQEPYHSDLDTDNTSCHSHFSR